MMKRVVPSFYWTKKKIYASIPTSEINVNTHLHLRDGRRLVSTPVVSDNLTEREKRIQQPSCWYHPMTTQLRLLTTTPSTNMADMTLSKSTNHSNHSNNNSVNLDHHHPTGQDLYQQAMDMLEQLQIEHQQRQIERSKQLYEAWQKAKNAEKDPKTQGVVVIQTLVRQTRKDKTTAMGRLSSSPSSSSPSSSSWQPTNFHNNNNNNNKEHKARTLLELAANQYEHPMALLQLGTMRMEEAKYLQQQTNNKEEQQQQQQQLVRQAMEFFRRAGHAGSRVGWYNLGQLLWTGYPAVEELDHDDNNKDGEQEGKESQNLQQKVVKQIIPPDMIKAMEAFTKAIDLGDADAMYFVGVHRMAMPGKEQNFSGFQLIQRAGDMGHGEALYYLALLYLNGEPTINLQPCTFEEFAQHLDRAVEAGSSEARFTRGHCYYHGTEGYPQRLDKALEDFLRAADEGHAAASVSAGAMLHTGTGAPKDQRRAFELYQHAGELGSKEGWKNVVACYFTGEGVPRSPETAQYIQDTILKETKYG